MAEANPFDRFDKPGGNPFDRFTPPPPSATEGQTSISEALWEGLKHGIGNIGMGAARLFSEGAERVGLPGMPQGGAELLGRAAEKREQEFLKQPAIRQHSTAAALGEFGGEMGASIPFSVGKLGTKALEATGLGKALAEAWGGILSGGLSGTAGGAVGAAANAPSGKGFAPAVGQGAAIGAGLGAGSAAVGTGLKPSAMDAPKVPAAALVKAPEARTWRDAARMLTSGGVGLTPLQSRGTGYKERSLQEWPILRGLVRGQVGNSVDDFNRAVTSQALSPIGVIVPRNIPAGHRLMDFGQDQFDRAYGRVLPHLNLNQGPTIASVTANPTLNTILGRLSTDDFNSFAARFQSDIVGRFRGGVMDGPTFKLAESSLSRQADRISGSRPELADALRETLSALRDELSTQNPTFAPELQKINQAFSMWARVRLAADRDATGKGKFEPSDLLQVLKDESPSTSTFGRGREPMQAFAEAGHEIIGPSLTKAAPRTSKSPFRMGQELLGGGTFVIPYGLAAGIQRIPGVRQAGEIAAPGAGAAGASYNERRKRGPQGGRIINQSSIPLGQ